MSFFKKYGKPQAIKVSKSMTPKELLKSNIGKQKRLLAGEQVLGQKGNLIKSWFSKGTFNPKVGIYGLFGEDKYACGAGKEKEMLEDFEKGFDSGEFDDFIKKVAMKKITSK